MVTTTQPRSKQIQSSGSTPRVTASFSSLSDHEILRLCAQYGTQAKLWKQRFLGLLPEVERRKLYFKEGCTSVFEFAAKVGGVSREQVLLTLRLDKRFETVPEIQAALTTGTLPLSKLSRVASVATPENQKLLLIQSKLLSNRSLETLVKDLKRSQSVHVHALKPKKTEKIAQSDEINLAPDVKQQLLDIQNRGLDLNQVLREMLQERNQKIQEEKQEIAQELMKEHTQSSRYIPVKVKKMLKQEYGEKCAQDHCTNKATNIHHTRRFGLNPSHNPLFLAPLCQQHHEIAHSLDVKVQEKRGGGEINKKPAW